jgi:hypothetical protein
MQWHALLNPCQCGTPGLMSPFEMGHAWTRTMENNNFKGVR